MSVRRVLIVGGGAAGLMAAGQAAEAGAEVVLLEKMARSGRKLSITGKGRCNLTNVADVGTFVAHFGATGSFMMPVFEQFFSPELMAFFEARGVSLVAERGGRVFPASGRAPDVVRALVGWVIRSGVQSHCRTVVDGLVMEDDCVVGVRCGADVIRADAVVLATGGMSYPATGSNGDGYPLAGEAGHTVVTPRPALVPLETAGKVAARLSELVLRNIRATLRVDGTTQREEFGELAFAPFGVTGPVVLTLSGDAVDALRAGCKVELLIDLKPALSEAKLDRRVERDVETRADEPMHSVLRGLLPKALVRVCLDAVGMAPNRKARSVSTDDRVRLRNWMKAFRLTVNGYRSFDEAIVTAGGVHTAEVDPRTMASRLHNGLYMAGELLNVQADTGGYNLQAAFSTGWVAGRAAAGVIG